MRTKVLAQILFISFCCTICLSQTTTVSGVVTDSDNFIWTSAQVSVTFVPNPSYPNLNQYTLNGQNLATYQPYNSLLQQSAITNSSSGSFSFTLLDNTQIQPAGSNWTFIVQSNTSAPASTYLPLQIYGSTFSVSTFLSTYSKAPRFPATPGVYGYGDVELTTTPVPGGMYFDTTTLVSRQWNGTIWQNVAGGSPGVTSINAFTGAFTFSGAVTCNSGSPNTCNFTGGTGGAFNLNIAEMGALTSGAVLNHTGHYVIPLAQTTSQINTLLAAAPNATYEFQNGDSVYNSFTNTNWAARIEHKGIPFFTHEINVDNSGVVCDGRNIGVTFNTASKTISTSYTAMTSIDIGKVMWAANSSTNQVYETQIQTIPTGLSFTVATFPPWTQSSNLQVWIGTDNTTNEQNAITTANTLMQINGTGYPTPSARLTFSAGACMAHTIDPKGTSWEGSGILTELVSPPAEDTFAAPDAYTTPTNQGAAIIHGGVLVVDGQIDATQSWTLINDSGTTSKPAFNRPAYILSRSSNNPLAPEWIIGSGSNGSGAINGAALTNGSTLICVLSSASSIPAVGTEIVFPYTSSGLIETTVASTAGSCGTGTARTLSSSIPATSQAEYFFGTNIQHTAIDFPASRTYPFALTLANNIYPTPASESGMAPYGTIEIGAETCTYYNVGYSTKIINITACTGTSVDHAIGSFIAPLNPAFTTRPWPVTPTLNSNDTTPSGAEFYPGHMIGNCGYAFPQSNGSANQAQAWSQAHISDLIIEQGLGPPGFNNTCGMYFVGLPYKTIFNHIAYMNTEYGIIEAQTSVQTHNITSGQPTSDGTVWKDLTFHTPYAFDFITGGQNRIENVDAYSQLGNASGGGVGCAGALYWTYGWDDQTGGVVSEMGNSSTSNIYLEPETGSHCGYEFSTEVDTGTMTNYNWHMGGYNLMAIGAQNAHWVGGNMQNGPGLGNSPPIINWGYGTTFVDTLLVGGSPNCNTYNYGFVSQDCVFINWGPRTKIDTPIDDSSSGGWRGNAAWGAHEGGKAQTEETFQTGNLTAPYMSGNAGYIDPSEWVGSAFEGMPWNHNLWTFDSSALVSQANVGCTTGTNLANGYCRSQAWNGNVISIGPGQRITNGKYYFYWPMKDQTAATNTTSISIIADCSGTFNYLSILSPINGSSIYPQYNITNAWPTSNINTAQGVVDFSSYSGCYLVVIQNGSSTADIVYTQFINFTPLPENFITSQLSILGSGQPTFNMGTNGGETWQTSAPSTGCGSTYPNGYVWHNLAGTAASSNRFWICDAATTTWNNKF